VNKKNVTPSWGNPTPHFNIGDISCNYERICTKFSEFSLQTRQSVLGKKNIEIVYPILEQPLPHTQK